MKRLWIAAVALIPAVLAAQGATPDPVAVVAQPPTKLPLTHAPQPTKADITAADLMTRLYIYAADSMMGREAGTIGNVKATNYIAAEVKRMGLQPAGEGGSFFQPIPLKTRLVDPASSIVVAGTVLNPGTDWTATGNTSLSHTELRVVYGGPLADSSVMLSPEQTAGRFVLFGPPRTPLSLRRMRNAVTVPGAAAVGVVVTPQYVALLGRPTTFLDNSGVERPASSPPRLFLAGEAALRLFETDPGALAPGDTGRMVSLDLRITTRLVTYPPRNVVAILRGSDPALRGQFVAIGAHNDHIGFNTRPVDHDSLRTFNHIVRPGGAEDQRNQATPEQMDLVNRQLAAWRAAHPDAQRPDSIYNGADDDGSGTVSVLEIAERLASLRPGPRRSILFVWHTGEEKGLLGAEFFTDNPTVPRDSIVAQLNLDMVGRGDAWDVTGLSKDGAVLHGNADYVQLVGSRRLSTELGDLIERVNVAGKHNLVFDYAMDADGHGMNIYCRSDHYEYARYGIPITFFTTGGHSDYHQVTDEPEYIDYAHMARVARLVEDVARHVANLDHRLAVDHPKPDPQGRCVQ